MSTKKKTATKKEESNVIDTNESKNEETSTKQKERAAMNQEKKEKMHKGRMFSHLRNSVFALMSYYLDNGHEEDEIAEMLSNKLEKYVESYSTQKEMQAKLAELQEEYGEDFVIRLKRG